MSSQQKQSNHQQAQLPTSDNKYSHSPNKKEITDIDHTKVHTDPTKISVASRSEQTAIRVSTAVSNNPDVDSVIIGDPGVGPMEIGYTLHADANTTEADIIRSLSVRPLEFVRECSTPISNYRNSSLLPRQFDGCISIYSHPATQAVKYARRKSGFNTQSTITWNPTKQQIASLPEATDWESTSPIRIAFTEVSESTIFEFEKTLKDVVTPSYTPEYLTLVEYDISNKHTPDNKSQEVWSGELQIKYERIRDGETNQTDIAIIRDNAKQIPTTTKSTKPDSPRNSTPKFELNDLTSRVNLTVTSPPYLDAINYSDYESNDGNDYTGETGDAIANITESATTEELIEAWEAQQAEIFQKVHTLTREGGFCAVVIGKTKTQGEVIDLPAIFSQLMTRELSWNFHEKITWHKVTDGIDKFKTTVQNNRPTYYHANQMTEECYIFRKGDIVNRNKDTAKIKLTDFVKKEVANNIWHIPTKPPNGGIGHPCPFPEELAFRLIHLYSYPNDIVFDPMAGSGTTLKTASHLDRDGIGVELEPKFINESRRRVFAEEYNRNQQKIAKMVNRPPEKAQIAEYETSKKQKQMVNYQ
jgi:site-specific DNA-methyltransferase (adenine-specific)